jgi:hypothetical protein
VIAFFDGDVDISTLEIKTFEGEGVAKWEDIKKFWGVGPVGT